MMARIYGILFAGMFGLALAGWAQPVDTNPFAPFAESLIVQLNLTPTQALAAQDLAQSVDRGLLVPVYPDFGPNDIAYVGGPEMVPLSTLIALRSQQLQAELVSEDTNPVAVQVYAAELVRLREQRQQVVAAGYAVLAELLTPTQQVQLARLLATLPIA